MKEIGEMTKATLRQGPFYPSKWVALIFAATAKGASADEEIKNEVAWNRTDFIRTIIFMCGLWQICC